MHLSGTNLLFWAAGLMAHLLLLTVLITRHRASMFPIFTALIATNVGKSLILYEVLIHGSKHTYFVAYFAFAIIDLILQLAVTCELAADVFCPTGTWAADVRKSFFVLVLGSVIVALALACVPAPPEKTALGTLLDRGNLFSSALQCELLVGMIAFSSTAGLPWKTHVARIAQGLGFYSMVGILTEAGHNVFSRDSAPYQALSYLRMATYLLCASYWMVMLWLNAPAPKDLPPEMRQRLFTLQNRVAYDLRRLRALRR